ncbi:formyltetrahydrofolate-dependent phosphoribosylglycinamide formyltransferase [Aneurinibacillus soli]|uniref:Phosphoribosylglycinamide formyltransferase n=1 Tax=Aneurinibacillus soli TaxID=1500254 RepID=A0A0U4WNT6_9BACL|nr:phosphoribosylglycinamide formyltransferase [Aneurinibacillus soli]PYE60611.1 formyltetrahydrofolate-dependent phosphoribosylglycinamide formyltransferase [Aneurinibacillus soli]BAU29865.1 Phosphoribosylglycinamide formyltransferase [Aneurinibacillus soli]
MKLAVFASGSGSNFGAIMEAIENGTITGADIVLLVCDKPGAYVLERAAQYGIPTFVFQAKEYPDKVAFETEILRRLEEAGVERIILAGYMRLIGETLLRAYGGRMINLHPSLLPSFSGKDAIGQAFRYGVKVTGITVHFVDEGMDTGPIIAQRTVEVQQGDTEETLAARIHAEEHLLLPEVVQLLVNNRVQLDGRRVEIIA